MTTVKERIGGRGVRTDIGIDAEARNLANARLAN